LPTYGYRCQTCSHEFEVWQKMTDEPVAACPTCGGTSRRLIFPVGIVFKGSGFYATDHRSPSGASSSKDGASSGGSPEKSDTETQSNSKTQSDTKSQTSPAPAPSTGSASNGNG
jgi:putative FmdB family regulatory protein